MTSGETPTAYSRLAMARVLLAIPLSLSFLPYVWGRVLIGTMLRGLPERLFLLLLIANVGLIGLLLLGTRPRVSDRFARWAGGIAFVGWVLANVIMLYLKGTGPLPKGVLLALMVPATIWVLWLAWIPFPRITWGRKWGMLAGFALLLALAMQVVSVEGLSGDGNVSFVWRPRIAQLVGETLDETLPAAVSHSEKRTGTIDSDESLAYPAFLGPERTAMLEEPILEPDWNSRPPELLWRRAIGAGWSAFAVQFPWAITQEQRPEGESVVCYDLLTGNEVWRHSAPAEFQASMGGPGPRATPTIHQSTVYALGATGLLHALALDSGSPLWTRDIQKDNSGETISHGVCSSPLVVDDLVLVCPTGTAKRSLVAYEARTGEPRWAAGEHPASYGSPQLVHLKGERQILHVTAKGLESHAPEDGRLLWFQPWENSQQVHCAQPLVLGNRVVFSVEYGKGTICFEPDRQEDGTWILTPPLWTTNRFQCKFSTPVVHDGFIHGLDSGILATLDPATGTRVWKGGRYGHGQILRVRDHLLVQAESGKIALCELSPTGAKEIAIIDGVAGKTWNNLALAGPYLLCRNDRQAACFRLPLADEPTLPDKAE